MWRPIIHLNLVRSVNFIVRFALARVESKSDSGKPPPSPLSPTASGALRSLCDRLLPLKEVEKSLVGLLSVSGTQTASEDRTQASYNPVHNPDVSTPQSSWRRALSLSRRSTTDQTESTRNVKFLEELGLDMECLWQHPIVQNILRSEGISLEEQPGLYVFAALSIQRRDVRTFLTLCSFLDQAVRVTRVGYKPQAGEFCQSLHHCHIS